jgi:hypothetical protein
MPKFTRFYDMCSGGRQKLEHDVIFIEGDEASATARFMAVFGRDPHNVTCSCCGQDYSVWECDTTEDEHAENPLVISDEWHDWEA